jgi:hypothetical protein
MMTSSTKDVFFLMQQSSTWSSSSSSISIPVYSDPKSNRSCLISSSFFSLFHGITWAKSRSKYIDIHLSFFNHRWCTHTYNESLNDRERENERIREEKFDHSEKEKNNVRLILFFFSSYSFHLTLDYDYVTDINS